MLSQIKNEIKDIMLSIDNVYNVYVTKKYANDSSTFLDIYRAENILGEKMIIGWFISRISTTEEKYSSKENLRTHCLIISGYLGLNEGLNSYNKFEEMIEDICTAFRGKENLNNLCQEISPIQIEKVQEKNLGAVLCHNVEMKMICTEKIQITE